jgi:hypothetical protein
MSQSHRESAVVQSLDKVPGEVRQDTQDDEESIHSINSTDERPGDISHIPSNMSHTHDVPMEHYSSHVEVPDEVYDRLPPSRKVVIVTLLSYCSFLAPISSTTILSAIPEVASTYSSTGTIINLSNALYMLFMGVSPAFWGPLSQVYGRRWVSQPLLEYKNGALQKVRFV